MRLVLLRAINGQLGGENPLKKAKLSYWNKLMTFEILSFHCCKIEYQQLSEIAYCSLLKQFVLLFSIKQLFSIDFSEVEKLLCVTAHVKHFKHVPRSNH